MSDRNDRIDRIDWGEGCVRLPLVPAALMRAGMYAAIYRVAGVAVADGSSRWRKLGKDVSPSMCERVRKAIPLALADLKERKARRVVHVAAQARLRAGMQGLSHERCVTRLTPTLREVAERAGMNYQTLVNFRASERPMSRKNMRLLANAMREMGLLKKKTLRGGGLGDGEPRGHAEA